MKKLLVAIPLGWLLALSGSPALADDVDQGWEFSFAPYLWALSLDGEIGVEGTTVDVDVPFSDLLKDLNFGLMGQFTARRGRWIGIFDGLYSELEDHETLGPRNIGFGPATVRDGPLVISIPRVQSSVGPTKVDVDIKMYQLKLAGGYRLLSHPLGAEDDLRRMTLDVYAGGRFWYMSTDVEVRIPQASIPGFTVGASLEPVRLPGQSIDLGGVEVPGATLGGLDETFSVDEWWIDPLVGMRLIAGLTERFELAVVGDLGGFGIGSASQFTWEAQGILGYRITDGWTLALGYRAIGLDRKQGSSGYDGTLHGPVLGAVYRWGAGRASPSEARAAKSSP
jgi:hypothetical protein